MSKGWFVYWTAFFWMTSPTFIIPLSFVIFLVFDREYVAFSIEEE